MRPLIRPGIAALIAAMLVAPAHAQAPAAGPQGKAAAPRTPAQAPAQPKATQTRPAQAPAPAPAAEAPSAPKISNPDQVVATVNGTKITKREVLAFLSRFNIPAGAEEEKKAYEAAINVLADVELIRQYLKTQKLAVTDAEIAAKIDDFTAFLKKQHNLDLATWMAQGNVSMPELRHQEAEIILWEKFLTSRATDEALKKFAEQNKDFFSGTQVRASHILLKVDPTSKPAERAKVRARLASIKKEIDSKAISFADAANKYSEDKPEDGSSVEGGDLGYFRRKDDYVESFSAEAFRLKPGQVSDPVETEYGFVLIQVTDRKEGKPLDFERNKPAIIQRYAEEMRALIIQRMREKARIDIKPMPADFFPPIQQAEAKEGAALPGTPNADAPRPAANAAPKPAAPR